jgi:hypothetical protein
MVLFTCKIIVHIDHNPNPRVIHWKEGGVEELLLDSSTVPS